MHFTGASDTHAHGGKTHVVAQKEREKEVTAMELVAKLKRVRLFWILVRPSVCNLWSTTMSMMKSNAYVDCKDWVGVWHMLAVDSWSKDSTTGNTKHCLKLSELGRHANFHSQYKTLRTKSGRAISMAGQSGHLTKALTKAGSNSHETHFVGGQRTV